MAVRANVALGIGSVGEDVKVDAAVGQYESEGGDTDTANVRWRGLARWWWGTMQWLVAAIQGTSQ